MGPAPDGRSKSRTRMNVRMLGVAMVGSIMAIGVYVHVTTNPVISSLELDTALNNPSLQEDYSSQSTERVQSPHAQNYDEILHMTTNSSLFVSRCRSGDIWRLEEEQPSSNSSNGEPIFRRVKSSVGFRCPTQPACTTQLSLPRTALLTYPRSGNTWTRHVLEQLTGLPTGAIYDAVPLRSRFLCEGHEKGVVVIKTHGNSIEPNYSAPNFSYSGRYDKIILILRNPYKSFVSHYQFAVLKDGLLGNAKINSTSESWKFSVEISVKRWKKFITDAIRNSIPKVIIFYEELTSNLFSNILRISQFLNAVNIKDFAFCCALKHQEGSFHKKTNGQSISDVFSVEQRRLVNDAIDDVVRSLQEQNPTVAKYLSSYKM